MRTDGQTNRQTPIVRAIQLLLNNAKRNFLNSSLMLELPAGWILADPPSKHSFIQLFLNMHTDELNKSLSYHVIPHFYSGVQVGTKSLHL